MNNIIVEKSVKALAGTVYSDSAEYEKTVERLFGEGCEIVRKEGKNCSRLDVYRKGTYCILLDDKSAGCPVIFTTVDFFDSTIQPWRVGFFREFKADKQMFSVLDRNMQEQTVDAVLPLEKYRKYIDTKNIPSSTTETLY